MDKENQVVLGGSWSDSRSGKDRSLWPIDSSLSYYSIALRGASVHLRGFMEKTDDQIVYETAQKILEGLIITDPSNVLLDKASLGEMSRAAIDLAIEFRDEFRRFQLMEELQLHLVEKDSEEQLEEQDDVEEFYD